MFLLLIFLTFFNQIFLILGSANFKDPYELANNYYNTYFLLHLKIAFTMQSENSIMNTPFNQSSIKKSLSEDFVIKEEMKTKDRNYIEIFDEESQHEQEHKPDQLKDAKVSNFMDILDQINKKQKIGKYQLLSLQEKQEIVKFSWETSIKTASDIYNISASNITRWRKQIERKPGAGRKINDIQMQNQLLQWLSIQSLGTVTKKSIQKKAREFSKNPKFKASKGWFGRFLFRNPQLNRYLVQNQIEQSELPEMTQLIGFQQIQQIENISKKQKLPVFGQENSSIIGNIQQERIANKKKLKQRTINYDKAIFNKSFEYEQHVQNELKQDNWNLLNVQQLEQKQFNELPLRINY